jgi:mono/diheme cytochrome c family protein
VIVGAVLIVAVSVGAIFMISEARLNQTIAVPMEPLRIPSDIVSVQRGQHLASAVAMCTDCHGSNLAGKVVVDDRALGRIVAPNLTRGRGGVGAALSDADLVRAIRHGVDPQGRPLLSMPSDDYNHFADADLAAIIAYVRSLPAIDMTRAPSELRPLGRAMFVFGQLPLQAALNIEHTAARPAAPAPAVTPEYGKYLTDSAGCPTCHGPGLSGGAVPLASPDTVQASNLTSAALGTWAETDFLRVMRTGVRPDSHRLSTFMPWPYFAQMTDDELRAIWRFLQAIPPRQTGTR